MGLSLVDTFLKKVMQHQIVLLVSLRACFSIECGTCILCSAIFKQNANSAFCRIEYDFCILQNRMRFLHSVEQNAIFAFCRIECNFRILQPRMRFHLGTRRFYTGHKLECENNILENRMRFLHSIEQNAFSVFYRIEYDFRILQNRIRFLDSMELMKFPLLYLKKDILIVRFAN